MIRAHHLSADCEGLGVDHLASGDGHIDGRHADLALGNPLIPNSWITWFRWRRLPVEIAGRNRMIRKMIMNAIRSDPGLE